MAYIDSTDTKKALNDAIRGNSTSNIVPTQVANQVIPVIEINPALLRNYTTIGSVLVSATGTGTVVATTAFPDRDVFISGFSASLAKDATCDTADGTFQVNYTQDGLSKVLLTMPLITLTAQYQNLNISLARPIKIDKNTAISVSSSTFTVGKMRRAITIYGYVADIA